MDPLRQNWDEELRRRLEARLRATEGQTVTPEDVASQAEGQRTRALGSLLSRGAAKIGSVAGGHVADTSGTANMQRDLDQAGALELKGRQDAETRSMDMLSKLAERDQRFADLKARRDAAAAEAKATADYRAQQLKLEGERNEIARAAAGNKTPSESAQEYVGEDGKVRIGRFITGKGLVKSPDDALAAPKGGGKPRDEKFEALPKPMQELVTDLTKKNASKVAITNQIDAELAKMRDAYANGKEDLAVTHGMNMLKVLNSTEGADAIGTDEAARLASFLKYKIANFTGPGSFMGRDVEQFFEQAADKSNSIKDAVAANQKNIDDVYAGTYKAADLPRMDTKLPGLGSAKPPAGTAVAAPQPSAPPAPKPGTVEDGYRFKGGDPSKPESWEKVQ